MRRAAVVAWAAGIALTLLAGAVQLTAPDEDARQSPFVQHVGLRDTASGREVTAAVAGVRLARAVRSGSWDGATTGVWVVVDVSVGTVLTSGLPDALLTIDGIRYDASDRPDFASLTGIVLQPGLPETGSFVFELPRAAVAGSAARRATIRIWTHRDPALDSAVDVTVDLTRLRVERSVEFDGPTRVTP